MGTISRDGARRIKNLVMRSERAPQNRAEGRGRFPTIGGAVFAVRVGSSNIAAAPSVDQWSSGVGYIREFDDAGAATSTEIEITLWNIETSTAILAGKHGLATEVSGKIVFFFEIGSCP